jgi:hypothetical protein
MLSACSVRDDLPSGMECLSVGLELGCLERTGLTENRNPVYEAQKMATTEPLRTDAGQPNLRFQGRCTLEGDMSTETLESCG